MTPTQESELSSLPRVREEGALTIRLEPDDGGVVVRAEGAFDITSARNLEDELHQALASGGEAVTLDLGQVEFIDSTGLRVLLRAVEWATENGIRLRMMRKLSPAVERTLTVSGVAERLPFTD